MADISPKCEYPLHVTVENSDIPLEIGCACTATRSVSFRNGQTKLYCDRHYQHIMDLEKKLRREAKDEANRIPLTEHGKAAVRNAEEKRERKREKTRRTLQ
jgi:hypothetical protein